MLMKPQMKYAMPALADIVVYAPNRHPVLAVNITGGVLASVEAAAGLRNSWLAHGLVMDCPFFLLVYGTALFLWRQETPAADLPDYVAWTMPTVDNAPPDAADYALAELGKSGLLFHVFTWLGVLVNNLRSADPNSEAEKMLIDSGVYARVLRGNVRFEADL